MVTHHRAQGWPGEEVDPVARLDELERTLLETLAEVELARRGAVNPWAAQHRGRHARAAGGAPASPSDPPGPVEVEHR